MLKLKTLITGITCVSIWFAGHARPQTNGQPISSFAIEWASGGGSGSLSAEYGAIHAIDGTKNMRIQGNSFKFRDTTGGRIECQLDSVNVAYGPEATLIHVNAPQGSFSFFLRTLAFLSERSESHLYVHFHLLTVPSGRFS